MQPKIGMLWVSLLALFNLSMIPVDFDGMELQSYQNEMYYFSNIIDLQNRGEAEVQKIVSWIRSYNRSMSDSLKQVIANEIWQMDLKYDNLNIDLICATITHESGWKPVIVSPAGAIGMMQIMPATGSFLAEWEGLSHFANIDLFNPVINIRLGCRYLSYLIDLHRSVEKALANYNGGPYQAKYYITGDIRLCAETRSYVPNVMLLTEKYGALQ